MSLPIGCLPNGIYRHRFKSSRLHWRIVARKIRPNHLGESTMSKPVISLQRSEAVIVQAAATIYAAHIAAGHVANGQEREVMKQAIMDAVFLAMTTDEVVQSDDELS